MLLPLWAAIALLQEPQQNPTTPTTPVVTQPYSFTTPQSIAETFRLRLTPKLDGKIEEEEWDPFTTGPEGKTYLQWEPGQIHIAASAPGGKDLVLSLDLANNGWLIGNDNIEVRVSTAGTKPSVTARRLDATNPSGPVWQDLPGFAVASQAVGATDVEVSIVDPGTKILPRDSQMVGVRFDLVPSGESAPQPYLPRVMSPVSLVELRAAALPTGLRWNVERNNRSVAPGEPTVMRWTFNGKNDLNLRQLEFRSEGLAKDVTNKLTTPFPLFDKKGRTYVDYRTSVAAGAEPGYRILRGTLTGADGVPAVMQATYRIAPLVEADLVQEVLPASDRDRSVRLTLYLRSSSNRTIYGDVSVAVPTGFRVLNGSDKQKYSIGERFGRARKTIELMIPPNTSGTFPITLSLNVNGKPSTQVVYLTVG